MVGNLVLHDISYQYTDSSEPLFKHFNASLSRGWTALLADNGLGKTTLAQLICGRRTPTQGEVQPSPRTLICAYCEQECVSEPEGLAEFRDDWSAESIALRDELGIGDDWGYRYDTLSGGERKRLQIACALYSRPDVLVLDEPTNHVDEHTRGIVAEAMRGFHGIGLLVSHDVELIDATCGQCLMLERRHADGANYVVLERYAGNYSKANTTRALMAEHAVQQLKDAKAKQRSLEHAKERRRQMMEAAARRKHAGHTIDRLDHDARNSHKWLDKQRDKASAASYRALGSRVNMAAAAVRTMEVGAKRYDGGILADIVPSARRELAHVDSGIVCFGTAERVAQDSGRGMPVSALQVEGNRWSARMLPDTGQEAEGTIPGMHIPALSVGPRDHIGLEGRNGSGKSTLVRALLSSVACDLPTMTIEQVTSPTEGRHLLAQLHALDADALSQVVAAYARLNADPDRLMAGEEPSPGQLQKLRLCLGLLHSPQLMVLDEPTNHLDLNSKHALASFLHSYRGAVIVVSHERWFLDEVCGKQ
ncbi:hypothetical protein BAAM0499_02350 [Bifidobacterium animalis subsp. animalis MCC 0499]|uniref:ATP-binding cassette domain-containing protein n=1 Tax=Bifidobacterium animalis TaxID=28025 RepID=UPI0006A474DA|nr:ATP-binding cassette domain-containing protein [Bifidobacterium animalis]KOA60821.1 hypothetical protein BAAM0499_02350 [Bifidobacterium animalis subsp. animalis MCC 0499]